MQHDIGLRDEELELLEQKLEDKQKEIDDKMRQWEQLNIKIDRVLQKIRERKANKE